MDIYPSARRVLLTAYADTDAAINAINVVDLDHYLLKPWDPPEEKLYPVIDGQLDAWRARDHRAVPQTKLVGHRWSARSQRGAGVPGPQPGAVRARTCPTSRRASGCSPRPASTTPTLPVVITADGEVLVEPTDAELADQGRAEHHAGRGLLRHRRDRRRPGRARRRGVRRLRGAAHRARRAHRHRRSGRAELADRELPRLPRRRVRRAADRAGPPAGAQVRRRDDHHPRRGRPSRSTVRPARCGSPTAAPIDAHTVILATGVSYRQLAAPGLDELTGRGVFYGSALSEAPACAGQDVYIVGGANSAGQAAVYFSRYARVGDHAGPRPVARASMSLLPDPADRAASRTSTSAPAPRSSRPRRRPPGGTDAARQRLRRRGEGARPGCCSASSAPRRAPTGWTAPPCGTSAGSSSPGPTWWSTGKRPPDWPLDRDPYHLETSIPGRLRRRRRAGRVGQAGGLRGRRGRDGRHAGAPVPGEAMTTQHLTASRAAAARSSAHRSAAACSVDELRTLFLFEKLTDEQLDWLCEQRPRRVLRAGPGVHRGRSGDLLLRAARRARWCCPAGSAPTTSRPPGPRSAACTPARCGPTWASNAPDTYNGSMRVTEPSRFFVLDAPLFAAGDARVVPDGACTCWRACSSASRTPTR